MEEEICCFFLETAWSWRRASNQKEGESEGMLFPGTPRAQAVRKEPSWEKDIGAECVNESMRDLAIPFSQLSRAQHSD